ncbi:MAG TPA: CerR family C-terminal domain-containing protein [Burkholderiaceae bacterium]|nr:CerR family C-terminal domain-containing protein [Burkholderiaceae bacterium]
MTRAPRELRPDGEATRARILDAAGELFAAAGYAETTGKSIAKRAGVSLASINYHFGGRQGLYRAVLIEAHRRVIHLADLRRLAEIELPAADKLGVLIAQLVRHATKRRPGWHVQVLAREILAPSSHIQVLLRSEVPFKLAIVKRVLSDITAIPADDPALARCLVSVVAPCSLLLIGARGARGPLHDVRQMPPDVIAAHLHRFALAGLEAIGREHALRMAARDKSSRRNSARRREPTG